MILDYIEGAPKEPGWYFINFGENQTVKPVFVNTVKDADGNEHLYAQIDIMGLPVEHMGVNAWAGPVWLRQLQVESPEAQEEQEDKPEKPVVEPELVEGE